MGDNPSDYKPNKGAESNADSSEKISGGENDRSLERKHVSYASIYLVLRYNKGK